MSDLHKCPSCDGTGERTDPLGIATPQECQNCEGIGWLDEHGEPLYLEPELTSEPRKETR